MIDNQLPDSLTEAEQAISSILSPTAGDEQLDLRIELGRTHIHPDEASKLRNGSVIRLDKLTGEPVDLYAGGRLIGRGEAIVLDGKLGVRVVELIDVRKSW